MAVRNKRNSEMIRRAGQYSGRPILEDVLNAFVAGLVILNHQGQVLTLNVQAASFLELSRKKAVGMPLHELLPKSHQAVINSLRSGSMTSAMAVPELDNCLLQITPIAGSCRGILLTLLDFRLWPGLSGHSGALDPLTPHLKAIFEASSDGISVANEHGVLVAVNEASARLTGMSRSELLGRQVNELVDKGFVDFCVSPEVIRTGKTVSRLSTYYRSGRQLLLTGTPFFDKHRNVKLVVINERDVTEMVRLEEDLKKAREVNAKITAELSALNLSEVKDQGFIAHSPTMKEVVRVALRLAMVGANRILITGESGTGKGLLAKLIHARSPRSQEPFVHINCAALPESLLEAELFGYEKGAFTGAASGGKVGLFEAAQEGTVFLDEIGELPLNLQAKLLTFLDDQTFIRVGGSKTRQANCAVTAATNQNIKELVAQKAFRNDLYYRLNTFSLHIPPLRQRQEDLQALALLNLRRLNEQYGLNRRLDLSAWKALYTHPFNGNVRELIDVLKKSVVLSDDDALGGYLGRLLADEVSGGLARAAALAWTGAPSPGAPDASAWAETPPPKPPAALAEGLKDTVEQTERAALERAAAQNLSTRELASMFKVSQSSISRKLRRYGLTTAKRRKASADSDLQ